MNNPDMASLMMGGGLPPAQMQMMLQQQMLAAQQQQGGTQTPTIGLGGAAPNTTITGAAGSGTEVKSTQFIRRGEEGNDGSGERGTSAPTSDVGPRYVYRDFSHLPKEATFTEGKGVSSTGSGEDSALTLEEIKNAKLPAKLNHMLMDPSLQHIISWMPHGRAWKILRPKDFTDVVLPRYFESVNYNSFVRLVNAWGFRRFTTGRDSNAYYHELFLKGMPHLHSKMRRLPKRARKAPIAREDEPDFYALDRVAPLPGSDADKVRKMALDAGLNLGTTAGFAQFGGGPVPMPGGMPGGGAVPGGGPQGQQMPMGQMNPMMMPNMMMNPMMMQQMNPMMMQNMMQQQQMAMQGMGQMNPQMMAQQQPPMQQQQMPQQQPSGVESAAGSTADGASAPAPAGTPGSAAQSSSLEEQRFQARLALMRDERNLLEQEAALSRKIAEDNKMMGQDGAPAPGADAAPAPAPAPTGAEGAAEDAAAPAPADAAQDSAAMPSVTGASENV